MSVKYKYKLINTLKSSIIVTACFVGILLTNKSEAFTPNVPNGGTYTISDEVIIDGAQYVRSGGTTINTTIGRLGRQVLENGGIAVSSIVMNNGLQDVLAGGTAKNTIIQDLGIQYVEGGKAFDAIIGYEGRQSIANYGVAQDSQIYNGGIQVIYRNSLADNTKVYYGGVQEISTEGKSINTLIKDHGLQVVRYLGLSEHTTVDTGGIQYVYQGGISKDTTINPGGLSIFYTGSIAEGTTLNNGILDLSRYTGTEMNISGEGGKVFVYNVLSTEPRELKVQSLTGEQTFIISADLANNKADKISIAGVAEGTHYIKVLRESTDGSELESITGKSTKVVQTGSGNNIFTGATSSIDGVKIMPIITQDVNSWHLVGYKIVGPSNLTLTDIAGANIAYVAVLSGRDSLKQRLGELRDNSNNYGVWGRIYGGEYSVDGSNMKYTTVQGGWDVMRKTGRGRIITGVLLEHLNSNNNYATGNGKTKNTLVGIYHAWFGENGHYYGFVFKTGRLHNNITVLEEEPIKGDYSISNSTVSAEYGYRHKLGAGYYIMPQLAMSFSWLSGTEYTTNSGTLIREDPVNSIIGRVGSTIGRKVNNAEFYLAMNLLHEFTANTRVEIGKSQMPYNLSQDFKGSTMEISLGGSINIGKKSLLYLDGSRSFGGKVANKWTVQLGYRYSW